MRRWASRLAATAGRALTSRCDHCNLPKLIYVDRLIAMEATTLFSGGQIVIPKALHESRHWHAGTSFLVEEVPQGILLKPVSTFAPSRLQDVMGCTRYRGSTLSRADINAALHADVDASPTLPA